MASHITYHFKLDLTNLPLRCDHEYNWLDSVGCTIPFTCDLFSGIFTIHDYLPKTMHSSAKIVLEYCGQILKPITTGGILRCQFNSIMKDYLPFWKYNIGDEIHSDHSDFIIIDRKYNGARYYKIQCLRCGFNSNMKYYVVKNKCYNNEYWIVEYKMTKSPCPCCGGFSKIIVKGINDINTTDPWMTQYFVNQDIVDICTYGSNKKYLLKCPDCGTTRYYSINNVHRLRHLPCLCNDNLSMPNKISYLIINSIRDQLDYYEREYSPKWIGRYRYDNYLVYHGKSYILEMDGGLGHGKLTYKSREVDITGLQTDQYKDMMAEQHNITVIRIDCSDQNYEHMCINVQNALQQIIGISIEINKDQIIMDALSNSVKEICEYYEVNKGKMNNKQIAKHFNVSITYFQHCINWGIKYGWCTRIPQKEQRKIYKQMAIQLKNQHLDYSTREIADVIGVSASSVFTYLTEGAKENKCLFNTNEDKELRRKTIDDKVSIKNSKKVYVYDMDLNFLGSYRGVSELERCSISDFGEVLKSRCVGRVCLGKRDKYKNKIFSYIPLNIENQKENKICEL